MKIYQLERIQELPISMIKAWKFFSNPYNLPVITPPNLNFQIKSKPPEDIYAGLLIEYRVSPLLRIPVSWITEITHCKSNEYFVDEQRIGPYKLWHHEHFFCEKSEQLVEMRDLIHYALPISRVSQIIHPYLVRTRLDQIFDFREQKLKIIFNHNEQTEKVQTET